MKQTPCHLIDDYIARDLTSEQTSQFQSHLPMCPECQQVLREESHLADLLFEATARLEVVPKSLNDRIRRRWQAARQRRLAAFVTALAASVAVLLMVSRFVLLPEPREPKNGVEVHREQHMQDVSPAADHVRVRFPANVVAIPVQSESPNVTFIQVHAGLRGLPSAKQDDATDLSLLERSNP
jgi:anti-sigma factor RsiW